MKNIGKPCAGEPHARFDEGGQAKACSLLYPLIACAARNETGIGEEIDRMHQLFYKIAE